MAKEGIGDPNTPATVVVGVLSAVLLFALVVMLQAVFYWAEKAENRRKVVAVAPEELAGLRAAQLEQLHSYRWVDQNAGVVAIPIERAMALVVAEQGRAGAGGAQQHN
ncbi:MAG: hypothetical protein AB1625_11290 [Acidobacteriota bacterium]